MTTTHGRKATFDPRIAAVTLTPTTEGVTVRLDDPTSPEFWAEVRLDPARLYQLLGEHERLCDAAGRPDGGRDYSVTDDEIEF